MEDTTLKQFFFKYVIDQKWILGSNLKTTYFLGKKNIFKPIFLIRRYNMSET